MNNKKRILVLGSGRVSKPGILYLLNQNNFLISVASNEFEKSQSIVKDYSNGKAFWVDANDARSLEALIKKGDIIISLLPSFFHVKVAKLCLRFNKDMVTASYVSEGISELDKSAREKGLLFLNELGADPGIDHMSAMKIIHKIEEEKGKILHFYSFCGNLPAPEDNNNPFGYKFSWSPKGVVLASQNYARFFENGHIVEIEGKDLCLNYNIEKVEGLGKFEVYANRDSMLYKKIYNLKDALTVMRGTFRYPGWCNTLKTIIDLGLVDETRFNSFKDISYKKMMAELIGADESDDIVEKTAKKIRLSKNSEVMKRLEWLGLFSDETVPKYDNLLDILIHSLQEKMYYNGGEKDMLLMRHKFVVENKDKSRDLIISTMVDYGIPWGDSSISRTVSLPLAIGVKLIAEGKINLTGVQIPIKKDIYEPILKELKRFNISLEEKRIPLQEGKYA